MSPYRRFLHGGLPYLGFLLLWSLCLCCSTAEGVSLRLLSTEFPPSSDRNVATRVLSGSGSHCLLLQLADDTPDVTIRFSYSTNVTSEMYRSHLVLTTHPPEAPYAGQITLHDPASVMEVKSFDRKELLFPEGSQQQRDGWTKKLTFTLRAKQEQDAASRSTYAGYRQGKDISNTEPVPGAYGICFGLDRQHLAAMPHTPVEGVKIRVHDVAYGHSKVARRPGGKQKSSSGGWFGSSTKESPSLETHSEDIYKSTVRKLYHADEGADVDKLLVREELMTNQELRSHLELVDKALKKLRRIQDLASWQRGREFDMRQTTESTFTRVWVATVVLLLGISISLYLTFSYTKRIIVKRKLI